MDRERKKLLVEASLNRAAEQIGDITQPALARYYAAMPEARDLFIYHDPSNPGWLESYMVEQSLFCLLVWFESPSEIRILLGSTIPHHIKTLGVNERVFSALLEAVCDVIGNLIPSPCKEERAVWEEMRSDLMKICEDAAVRAQL